MRSFVVGDYFLKCCNTTYKEVVIFGQLFDSPVISENGHFVGENDGAINLAL